MVEAVSLDDIALGATGPAEAREAIGAATERVTAAGATRLYAVLRAWTWKALSERRRDDDLREWHDILQGSAALLLEGFPVLSARVETLSELIYESVAVSNMFAASEPLKRHQVRQILGAIHDAGDVTLPRLQVDLRMERGDLLRLVNLLLNCDLVRRVWSAAEPSYQLASPKVWRAAKAVIPAIAKTTAPAYRIAKIGPLPDPGPVPSRLMSLAKIDPPPSDASTSAETLPPIKRAVARRDHIHV